MTYDEHLITDSAIGIAVDYGSTTISMTAIDVYGKEISSISYSNPQTASGHDVITRIKKCLDDDSVAKIFYQEGREQLYSNISKMGIQLEDVTAITISGNAIMQHLFQQYSVEGFAYAPFYTVTNDFHSDNIFYYPPGFSPYVGADLMCGAQYLNLGCSESYDLMIDLGTNGEILLMNQQQGYATSTACGPVFDFAIGGAQYGSDCIHAIAQCVKRNLIDSNGKIADAFFDKGIKLDTNFIIKQENIRNFQLAKGAILAGILCLLNFANIKEESINNVYICGGLGFYMETRDAYTLNMFPKSVKNKIKICGNTSLNGAKILTKSILQKQLGNSQEYDSILIDYENMRNKTRAVELSNLNSFQEIYMNSLNF